MLTNHRHTLLRKNRGKSGTLIAFDDKNPLDCTPIVRQKKQGQDR